MRLKIAVPLVLAGLLLAAWGVAQTTFWAPAQTMAASTATDVQKAPVVVVDADIRPDDLEKIDVTVQGEGDFVVAIGRADDVEAWVGKAAHVRLTGVTEDKIESSYSEGEKSVPDPRGSDLWVSEDTASGETVLSWVDPAPGEWSLLIAADGKAPAPTSVSISWPNDETTPFAVPLIVVGALLSVLGIALAFTSKRGGGRRATASAPRSARRAGRSGATAYRSGGQNAMVVPALRTSLTAAVLLGLVATGTPAATASTAGSEEGAPAKIETTPALLESQLVRILESVATAVEQADAARDPEMLEARVDGAAQQLRSANYQVRAKAPDEEPPVAVAAEPLLTQMITTEQDWPRTVVAVTQGEANEVPQALVLTQAEARSNYQLVSAMQMLPGTTFPKVPAGGTGVAPQAKESGEGLKASPVAALETLADTLTASKLKTDDGIAENTFVDDVIESQTATVKSAESKFADIKFTHTVVPERTHALRTGDGGAIVFGYLNNTYASSPKGPGDTLKPKGVVEQLLGKKETEKRIDVQYGQAVMMYIPPKDSGSAIQVIGAAQALLSAKLK
ncbi:hypothetical protein [Arthrobacter roseus]|uniref:hypothetical protein n=1 Tax=Arthrobacter roseus TaxID=136274 RepID=UPI001963B287|nr:hypothetical protein [Arthrobacter roseus]MBM7849003.1 hypothetical protein [Arthrobacter roseus]